MHVSEMSWTRRVRHPSKLVNVGDPVEVMVLEVNKATKRISLGMKQVETDPWATITERYQPGMRVQGKVRNLTDFGAFVELEPGVDGLLHISDMSWTRNIGHPSELLKKGQPIDTQILNVDRENKRISLGLKQIQPDPWDSVASRYPMGSRVTGKVVRLTDFGAFVELEPGVDGLLHISQMSSRPIATPADILNVGDELTLHGDPGGSQRAADRALARRSWPRSSRSRRRRTRAGPSQGPQAARRRRLRRRGVGPRWPHAAGSPSSLSGWGRASSYCSSSRSGCSWR